MKGAINIRLKDESSIDINLDMVDDDIAIKIGDELASVLRDKIDVMVGMVAGIPREWNIVVSSDNT